MSFYLFLKTLHILSSTLLFGTGLGSAYYALRAWRSGNLEIIAVTFRHLVTADWLFIATTAVFQPISGLALTHLAGWPLSQTWLLWSLGSTCWRGCAGYRWSGCKSACAIWLLRRSGRAVGCRRWPTYI